MMMMDNCVDPRIKIPLLCSDRTQGIPHQITCSGLMPNILCTQVIEQGLASFRIGLSEL